MEPKIVAVYGRVSDAEDIQSSTVPLQLKKGVEFAREKWPDASILEFEEIKSAQFIKSRPIFCEMLTRAVKENFHAIVVRDQDRLSRDTQESLMIFAKLAEKKVEVWTYSNRSQVRTDNPQAKFLATMLSATSAFEREMTGVRTQAKILELRSKGLYSGGHIPKGYCLNAQKEFVPDPVVAEKVKRVFQIAADTRSLSHAFQAAKDSGLLGSKQGVQFMLKNRIYLGEWNRATGNWQKGHHAALIDEDTFLRAQRTIPLAHPIHVRKVERVYLLQGIVYCQHCGRAMRHHHTKKKNGLRIHYYDCKNASTCPVKRIPADQFEGWAWKRLAELCQNPKVLKAALREHERSSSGVDSLAKARLAGIQSELQDTQTRQGTVKAYMDSLFKEGKFPASSLNDELAVMDDKIKALKIQEVETKRACKPKEKIEAEKFIRALRELLADGNLKPQQKQTVLKTLIARIDVSETELKMHLIDPSKESWFSETSTTMMSGSHGRQIRLLDLDSNQEPSH